MTDEKRKKQFWARVGITSEEDNECWPWLGSPHHEGYGQTSYHAKWILAHRLAYFFDTGELDPDKVVCHDCNNKICCRPSHLYQATQAVNSQQAHDQGRAHTWPTKLNWDKVRDIRRRHDAGQATQKQLAAEYTVDQKTISDVINRKTWRRPGDTERPRWQRQRNRAA